MNPFRSIAHRLRHLLFRRRIEAEMAEEIRLHLEHRAAEHLADGMSVAEAHDAAQRQFGNMTAIRESAWDAHGWRGLERLLDDLRLALRQLAKTPGFALLAIVTLGLGIGANTSMFNLMKHVVLRPLPYADNARLDRIYRATAQDKRGGLSAADFLDLRREAEAYGEVAAYRVAEASLSDPGRPAEMASAARATANLFSLLGVTPQLGRTFRAGDDLPGNDRIVLLSPRTWRNRFDGRSDVIGRTIRVDGEPHQIVGVLPEEFNDSRHLGSVDLFRPLPLEGRVSGGTREAADRTEAVLRVVGRRAPNRSRRETGAFLAAFGARLAREFPAANAGSVWRVVPLEKTVVDAGGRAALSMIIGLSAFVLLIACSNLANFLLARTMARARELAVRSALGASRMQLLRPLILESLALALAGGVCALFVAVWFNGWAAVRSTADNGEVMAMALDWPVFAWAFAASLATALAFGSAPALFALRLDLNGTLKSGGRGSTGGRTHQRFRRALIVGQFALVMVLLAGAAIFIRGLDELNNRRSGWASDRLVTARYLLPDAPYGRPADITAFHRRTLERLEALPGVASASIQSAAPFFDWADARKVSVEGRARPDAEREPAALFDAVTPRYFETFGTPLLAGRAFSERDSIDAPPVFVINQTMARNLFGGKSPIGRRLTVGEPAARAGEIVGVAADVQSVSPDTNTVTFQVYVPMAQEPQRRNELAVRASGIEPAALVARIRSAMTEIDPDLPLRNLQPADAMILRSSYQLRVLRDVLVGFAVVGLALACIGIYGVIARLMAQRTSEFAIRLALGARVADITRLVLASGVTQALAGSAIGLLGALGVSRLIGAAYPGMRTNSPGVLLATTLLLVGVALLACWIPARRARRIDATLALRAE